VAEAQAASTAAVAAKAALPDLALACGMACLAGATDVCGLLRLRDLFVSFMSGNTTMLGVALGHGDWKRAGMIAGVVGLFVTGAAAGAVLGTLAGRWHMPAVATAVAAVLCVPLLYPDWMPWVLTLAMGMLNAAISRVSGVSVGLTYVTGTLVKLGQGIGHALLGRGGRDWALQAPLWLSLLAGAVAAGAAQWAGQEPPWPLPVLAAALAAAALVHELRHGQNSG